MLDHVGEEKEGMAEDGRQTGNNQLTKVPANVSGATIWKHRILERQGSSAGHLSQPYILQIQKLKYLCRHHGWSAGFRSTAL